MIWIGSMTDKKHHLTFAYSLDWIEYLIEKDELFKLINRNFGKLENVNKQRILVLKMQLTGFKPSDFHGEQCYLIEDINRYCKENRIDFTASDSFEDKNNG